MRIGCQQFRSRAGWGPEERPLAASGTRRMVLWLALVWALLAATLPAAAADPGVSAASFKDRVAELIRSSGLSGHAGVYIRVLKTGRVLSNERGDTPMIPASNMKVLTTATGLDLLGADFRYETELLGPEPDANGVIAGHLYLRGTGDPSFCEPFNTPATEPFRFFIRELRKAGVKSVVGDVVADDSAFDREFLGQGWLDRYLLDDYAAGVSALSVNANLVDLAISSKGVVLNPSTDSITIVNKLKSSGYSEVYVDRKAGSDVVTVSGCIAPGDVVHRLITVNNPPLFSAGVFSRLLEKGGIHHRGTFRLIDPLGEAARANQMKVYARFRSPRLVELVTQINKESDNLFAQHLFKSLGERHKGRGSAANGQSAVMDFMRRNNIDPTGLKMVDGCGLSTLDRVSPRQLVDVLNAMWLHPLGQTFIDTLPAGGEGTLHYRFNGLSVRAKTGTLRDHSALSGYVVSAYGQTIGFSILVNDVDGTWRAVDLQNRIVQTISSWQNPL